MKLFISFLVILMNVAPSFACNISENELAIRLALMKASQASLLRFEDPIVNDYDISKGDFKRLIDSVKRVYIPIFKKKKMNLKIEAFWEDKQTNAYAGLRGTDRYVLIYGGYARHRFMTKDAFLSVVCHEIGHHLGGFPKKAHGSWSSSEGQADYFSTLKCMKEVLRSYQNNEVTALSLNLPEMVKKECRYQFPVDNDYFICLRSAKAAEDHGRVISDLTGLEESLEVSLITPSEEKKFSTSLQHPSPQCRVDTKYQGALCNVPTSIPLDDEDEKKGACHLNNFNILGVRPSCWFVHKK
jgi:hypothetical protein